MPLKLASFTLDEAVHCLARVATALIYDSNKEQYIPEKLSRHSSLIPRMLTGRIDAPRTGNISGASGLHPYRLKISSGSRFDFLYDAVGTMN